MTTREPASFTGVDTYIDPLGRFSVRYPTDWHEFKPPEDREGVTYSPATENPRTYFSVWVSPLGESVVAEDLEDLKAGVDEGIEQMPGVQVESAMDDVLSNLIKFERVFTFEDDGVRRKCKQWILYVDTWLYVVVFQGENEEEYDYWLPMGNYSFAFFNLPEALWFMVDRDLAGVRAANESNKS